MINDDIKFLNTVMDWKLHPNKVLEFKEYLNQSNDLSLNEKCILNGALGYLSRDYKILKIGDESISIDLALYSSIVHLLSLGYKTMFCCSGHLLQPAYIMLDGLYDLHDYNLVTEYDLYRNRTTIRSYMNKNFDSDLLLVKLVEFTGSVKSIHTKLPNISIEDVFILNSKYDNVSINDEYIISYLLGKDVNEKYLLKELNKRKVLLNKDKKLLFKDNINNLPVDKLDDLLVELNKTEDMNYF